MQLPPVIKPFADQRLRALCLYPPAVVQALCLNVAVAVGGQLAAAAEVIGLQVQIAPGGQNALPVAVTVKRHIDVAFGSQAAVFSAAQGVCGQLQFAVSTGFASLQFACGGKLHIAFGVQRGLVQSQFTPAVQAHRLASLMVAAQRHSCRRSIQAPLCQRIIQPQLPIGIQLNIALTRVEVAEVDPNAFFTGDQVDAVGVHATKRTSINRHLGRVAAACNRRGLAGSIYPVGPERDAEVLGVQLRVNLGCAGDQGKFFALAGVQPFTLNGDCPLGDFQRLQLAVSTQHRLAGRQRRVGGIDKAAAVAGDAIGVGNHHAGLLARDLQVTAQL
ncbi:hypothetical protein D3C75_126560 [compost metagenome]